MNGLTELASGLQPEQGTLNQSGPSHGEDKGRLGMESEVPGPSRLEV